MSLSADYVVVGSGVAGLYFAIKAAEYGSVILLTKSAPEESNTRYAQGGIAAVVDPADTHASHVADTLAAGDGLCDQAAVEFIVGRGAAVVEDLERLGARFTRGEDGRLSLGREGGHSRSRVVRADDLTGGEVARALLAVARDSHDIELRAGQMVLDLMLDARGRCVGTRVLDSLRGEVVEVGAGTVLLATGGCGRIYLHTTNPAVATGDGLALAYRAGARLANMEFVQFHPTVLYLGEGGTQEEEGFLISEAVRGYGGVLINHRGERFVDERHPLGSLATRDVLSRVIVDELQQSGQKCVYLDVTHKDPAETRRRFPNIFQHCLSMGVDMTREPIPVVPAAHYMCGGVCTDLSGRTDIPGLYVSGETGMTGLHGANRLASNSLLEGLVISAVAAAALSGVPATAAVEGHPCGAAQEADVPPAQTQALRRRVQSLMWEGVGIVRSDASLVEAVDALRGLGEEVEALHRRSPHHAKVCELRNMVTVAGLIASAAQQRRESRGGHYNIDHPRRDDAHWRRVLFQRRRAGKEPGASQGKRL